MKETLAKNNIDWFEKLKDLSASIGDKLSFNNFQTEKICDELTLDFLKNEKLYHTNSTKEVTIRINQVLDEILNSKVLLDPTSSNFLLEGDIPFNEREEIDADNLRMLAESTTPYSYKDLNIIASLKANDNRINPEEYHIYKTDLLQLYNIVKESKEFHFEDILVVSNNIDLNLYKHLLKNQELIKTLNWRIFEKLLADILETFGYKIDLMQGTKDGGIDIIAFGKNAEFGSEKYIIQAKRYKNKVGVEPVRSLLFNRNEHRTTKACLATTSTFTKGAWNLQERHKWQLELKDFNAITKWLKKSYELKSITKNNI